MTSSTASVHAGDSDHVRYRICVSGAAQTEQCGEGSFEIAMTLGKEIASRGAILIDGATTGFPFWVARGAKEAGGMAIGVSPAATDHEHANVYKLPFEFHDLIVYTGFGYAGRNLLMTRSSDAVIIGCGRIGTFNEFTIAFEDNKPIGVLEGPWATDDIIKEIIAKAHRGTGKLVFSSNPKELVDKIIALIERESDECDEACPDEPEMGNAHKG
ncbi:MAG: hypothetical protein WC246_00110 [Candidatus Paceibacterota bacterium]